MSREPTPSGQETFWRWATPWLERLTAVVLLLVLAVVGWMVGVASQPGWPRLPSVEMEVVVVLGLLTVALVLVSVVALLHTQNSGS